MPKIPIEKIRSGMIIAEPVFNANATVELLRANTELTDRHIHMLKQQEIYEIAITDKKQEKSNDPTPKINSDLIAHHSKVAKNASEETGVAFDVLSFQKDLHELEDINNHIYNPGVPNAVNEQMIVNVLTGEGNVPIDVRHSEALDNTKNMFVQLKTSDTLDLTSIRENVEEILPDIIRNNDVLMRLDQLKAIDNETFDHSLRLSILSTMLGKWLDFPDEKLLELNEAALLANIGNMKIPSFILQKPEPLTPDEFEIIKKHCQFGYSVLLKTAGVTDSIKYSALQHHERIDGSGYPLRLRSGQIHEFAKIIMVCDIFVAMTSDRPYRKKHSPFDAAEYILWQSGVTLDTKICYVFLQNISKYFIGKKISLSNGKTGKIIYVDPNHPTKPTIQIEEEFIDLTTNHSISIIDII